MDNLQCFSIDNTSCRLAGFPFTEAFDCRVCLKYGYMRVIHTVVQRGQGDQLTAESLLAKISASRQDQPAEPTLACIYRGKLLQSGSCKCGAGSIYECSHPGMVQPDGSPGRQIGKVCVQGKCKGYEAAATASNI